MGGLPADGGRCDEELPLFDAGEGACAARRAAVATAVVVEPVAAEAFVITAQ